MKLTFVICFGTYLLFFPKFSGWRANQFLRTKVRFWWKKNVFTTQLSFLVMFTHQDGQDFGHHVDPDWQNLWPKNELPVDLDTFCWCTVHRGTKKFSSNQDFHLDWNWMSFIWITIFSQSMQDRPGPDPPEVHTDVVEKYIQMSKGMKQFNAQPPLLLEQMIVDDSMFVICSSWLCVCAHPRNCTSCCGPIRIVRTFIQTLIRIRSTKMFGKEWGSHENWPVTKFLFHAERKFEPRGKDRPY